MKNTKYYIRLDDASPFMDDSRWRKAFSVLDKYNIKALIGVIPNNKDELTAKEPYKDTFWQTARDWRKNGHIIALHGYDHCYLTQDRGINPIHARSEFAGVSLEKQRKKIKDGYAILKSHGLTPEVFYAPSHTFDTNTIRALIEETPIRIISDTIAFRPYKSRGLTFIPQQIGQFRDIPFSGDYTFCFHPNNMDDKDFERFELFIKLHRSKFNDYGKLLNTPDRRKRNLIEKLIQQAYYLIHRIKK